MASPSLGTHLSKIARRWAGEIDVDDRVVASILYKWQRGDFESEKDPALPSILSSVDSPRSAPPPPTSMSASIGGAQINVPGNPVTAKDYLEENITDRLENHDPHISFDDIREFCNEQDIPLPDFLSETPATTQPQHKPSARELGKLNTAANKERMWEAHQKLEKKNPDKSASWLARNLAMTSGGQGYGPETIRKTVRERKKLGQ